VATLTCSRRRRCCRSSALPAPTRTPRSTWSRPSPGCVAASCSRCGGATSTLPALLSGCVPATPPVSSPPRSPAGSAPSRWPRPPSRSQRQPRRAAQDQRWRGPRD
jgi:hypothetical protein